MVPNFGATKTACIIATMGLLPYGPKVIAVGIIMVAIIEKTAQLI
jgi:hypothetical protein